MKIINWNDRNFDSNYLYSINNFATFYKKKINGFFDI